MAVLKSASKKSSKPAKPMLEMTAKAWKKDFVNHKKAIKAADAAIKVLPKWSQKRLNAICDGLLTAHYILHSPAVGEYMKTHPWISGASAINALASARNVFNQAIEFYENEEYDDFDEEEEENDDESDDSDF